MSDQDDALSWVFVTFCALFGLALIIGLGLWIAAEFRQSSAKQDCRASGRRVIEDAKGEEWWCAPLTPEKP